MSELEQKLINAFNDKSENIVGFSASFDGVYIEDMTRDELELLCKYLASEFFKKNPTIEACLSLKK